MATSGLISEVSKVQLQGLLHLQEKCRKEKESWAPAKKAAFAQANAPLDHPSSYYKIFYYTF